jgi:hypothetical protein
VLLLQAIYGAADFDVACAHRCSRVFNAAWNPWRSDCSGLVSYAYSNLVAAPGDATGGFPPYSHAHGRVIHASELAHGDVLNSKPREHIFLFDKCQYEPPLVLLAAVSVLTQRG